MASIQGSAVSAPIASGDTLAETRVRARGSREASDAPPAARGRYGQARWKEVRSRWAAKRVSASACSRASVAPYPCCSTSVISRKTPGLRLGAWPVDSRRQLTRFAGGLSPETAHHSMQLPHLRQLAPHGKQAVMRPDRRPA